MNYLPIPQGFFKAVETVLPAVATKKEAKYTREVFEGVRFDGTNIVGCNAHLLAVQPIDFNFVGTLSLRDLKEIKKIKPTHYNGNIFFKENKESGLHTVIHCRTLEDTYPDTSVVIPLSGEAVYIDCKDLKNALKEAREAFKDYEKRYFSSEDDMEEPGCYGSASLFHFYPNDLQIQNIAYSKHIPLKSGSFEPITFRLNIDLFIRLISKIEGKLKIEFTTNIRAIKMTCGDWMGLIMPIFQGT